MRTRQCALPIFAVALFLGGFVGSTTGADHDGWLDNQIPNLLELYRHLHRNPELSLREVETAKRIAAELREAQAEVTTGVGKLGVVAILKNGPGPLVLVRTDLDALPVTEETGLPYASKVTTQDDEGNPVGAMHACGHDLHMTCLVGVARWLSAHRDRWSGTVMLIGQPAEEKVGGAELMLKGEHNIARIGYAATDPEFLYTLYHSDNIPGTNFNRTMKPDPELDRMIEAMNAEADVEKRRQLSEQIQKYIMDQALIVPLYNVVFAYSVHQRVQNVKYDLVAGPYFYNVWLAPA